MPLLGRARRKPRVWYVDPLDGTGEFVACTVYFPVIIGLLEKGRPKIDVFYRPVGDVLYAGVRDKARSCRTATWPPSSIMCWKGNGRPWEIPWERDHADVSPIFTKEGVTILMIYDAACE